MQFTFYVSTFDDGDDPAVADIPKLIYEFATENGYNCTYADYVADEGAYEGERRFDVECHDMFSEDQAADFDSGVSDYLDSAGWYVENSGFDRLLRA